MPCRMLPDEAYYRCARPSGVMEVSDAVGEARPEMEQGHGGFLEHSAVAIGSSGADAFKEAQNRLDARPGIERQHYGHFCSSGIGKAYLNTGSDSGLYNKVGTVHSQHPIFGEPYDNTNRMGSTIII